MPRPPRKKEAAYTDLPVLTELPDTDIPVLTERLIDKLPQHIAQNPEQLSDKQCQELAAQLGPQLEALLRERLTLHFESLWQRYWGEVEKSLPDLIRAKLSARTRHSSR
jgi:hypothetical protein